MSEADDDFTPGSVDVDGAPTAEASAGHRCAWLTGVLGRLFTLGDLSDPPNHGGWRA